MSIIFCIALLCSFILIAMLNEIKILTVLTEFSLFLKTEITRCGGASWGAFLNAAPPSQPESQVVGQLAVTYCYNRLEVYRT